jgi:hypothetical protein
MQLMPPYDLLGPGGPGWGHLGTPANPYRFLITPLPNGNTDQYYDLSLAPAGFWAHVRSDGGDIRIFAQDGVTPLPREVSGFDPVGQLGSLFIGSAGNASLFLATDSPSDTSGTGPYELGMIFYSDIAGYITALKYYRNSDDTAAHDGHLWDAVGALLATATFPASSSVGWQTASLTTPVAITANVNYTVSYSISGTSEPRDTNYFTTVKNSGHLHAPVSAGVYGTMGTFPSSSYLASNYYADVDFCTKEVPDTAFYVTYGNPANVEPAPGSPYGKYAVWESAATGVWHMEDPDDSTANQNNGTIANPYPILESAKIREGYQFNAVADNFIVVGVQPSLDFSTGFTLGAWVYKAADFVDGALLGKIASSFPFDGYMLWTGASPNQVALYINRAALVVTSALSDGWHRIIATWDGTQLNLYVDGIPGTPVNYAVVPASSSKSFVIGGYSNVAINDLLDEAIVLARPWSAQEVTTDYANQNDPGAFWTTGPET